MFANSRVFVASGRILVTVCKRNLSKMYSPPDRSQLAALKSGYAKKIIDLRSDTLTKPTELMKKAAYEAELGDDVLGEDPTMNSLQERVAKLLGKEDALFVSSGTMGNLVAILAHCDRRGDYALIGDKSHILLYEGGGASELGGIMLHTAPMNEDGTYNLADIDARMRKLVCVENTFNGRVLPLKYLREISELIHHKGGVLHMDGARIFNAAVKLKVPVENIVRHCDTVTFCFSKGLSCPIGSMLAGPKTFIERARRLRHLLGGAMRQVGVLAGYAHVALDNMVERLAEDHRRMAEIVKVIREANSPNITVQYSDMSTNMGIININPKCGTADDLRLRFATVTEQEASDLGQSAVSIQCYPSSKQTVRFVTYSGITDEDVHHISQKVRYVIQGYDANMLVDDTAQLCRQAI